MTVAVLGTGIMGSGMARNMRRAGLEVRAWNRTKERADPLAADGITVTDQPNAAVDGASVVVTMMYDAAAVAEVIEPINAPQNILWLQTSTVGIDGAEELAGIAARKGWTYVDAPVLGTKAPADNGTLIVLASGPAAARDPAAPIFDAIGSRTLWLGPAGSGSRLKLVMNSWIASLTAAIAQSVTTARGLGLDPALFLDVITGSATDNPYAHVKGQAMIDRDFTTSFSVSGAAKDCRLIAAAVEQAGVNMTLANAVSALFDQAEQQGLGADDMSAVAQVFGK